jgi:hypothetical protein
VTDCTAYNCLYIKNSAGANKAIFDSAGDLDLTGTLTPSSVGAPNGNDFVVKNSAGTVRAWIDDATGNMRLAGTASDKNGGTCSPPANSFIIKNSAGQCKAYIDSSGNLWLAGTLNTGATGL